MRPDEIHRLVTGSARRVFIGLAAAAVVAGICAVYARFVEPTWLAVRKVSLSKSPSLRLIHVSDIHYAGNTRYLERVVQTINSTKADLVCFTGDLVEKSAFMEGVLRMISRINKPVYGVPGNHDYWEFRSFDRITAAFRGTGGDWLADKPVFLPRQQLALVTVANIEQEMLPGFRRILLEHDPYAVSQIDGQKFDLILSGHTHGGQVRIPLVGRWLLPFDLGPYDKGLFQTPCGPLYVNPGIGTFYWNARFLCRPEITVIEI